MANEYTYTFSLVDDEGTSNQLREGAAKALGDALGGDKVEFTSETQIPLNLLDNVTRCSWSEDYRDGDRTFRIANPDECEQGATRLSDLIDQPKKLARGLAHLLEEESELELVDDDIVVLSEFIGENDSEVEISSESTVESIGIFVLHLANMMQAAADGDAHLLLMVTES